MFDMKFAAPLLAGALIAAAPIAAPLGGGGVARAASFDCAHAGTPTEVAICGDASLSALDSAMGAAYDQRVAADPILREIQRAWLAARNVGCGHDRGCLRPLMTAQLTWLKSGAAQPPAALPRQVGHCSLTSIKVVETRLEDTPGSGSAIGEVNGGYQVSYDTIPAMDASRRGDPVLECLISIPHPCPPGDTRGRVYAVGNLRTLQAWSQPDAEHMCGGA
ncbi:MAG TPA: lysozyme inhibitor LprI family protein [Caulobacteraceae bacterium]|jgi:uncharacterized protein|nr:lysozyme inhibitor LprI family protein [Caulobacteraceae bacterium]